MKTGSSAGRALWRFGWAVLAIIKRVGRQKAFFAVIAIVFLLSAAFAQTVDKKEGFRYVSVYCADDPDLRAAVSTLEADPGALSLSFVSSPEEAKEDVLSGKADCALIFRGDPASAIEKFLDDRKAVAIVYVGKENDVYSALTRERAFTTLFPQISEAIFSDALSRLAGREVGAEEAERYYGISVKEDELIALVDLNDRAVAEEYFAVSPARGMLALVVLCAAMTFAVLSHGAREKRRFALGRGIRAAFFAFGETALPTVLVALAAYAAQAILGLVDRPLYVLAAILLHALAASGLCLFFEALLRSGRAMAIALIALIVGSATCTPIFMKTDAPRALLALFPAGFYLLSLTDAVYLGAMALYAAATLLGALGVYGLRERVPALTGKRDR